MQINHNDNSGCFYIGFVIFYAFKPVVGIIETIDHHLKYVKSYFINFKDVDELARLYPISYHTAILYIALKQIKCFKMLIW